MRTPVSPELHAALARISDELSSEFAGILSHETITRYLEESAERFLSGATVTRFVPILVQRFARERLQALGQAKGTIGKPVPEVLFVCVHNAGRSQMAATLLDHHALGRVHVRSAGSAPAEEVNPMVVEALAEMGLDASKVFSKPLTDEVVRAADLVITMGCGDACPVYPGKRYLDWDLPDPAEKSLDEVRPIRDEIERRVLTLLQDLTAA